MSRCNSSVKCTIAGHCGSSAGAEAGREGSSLTLGAGGGGKSRAAALLQARVERDGKFRASAVMVCPPAQPAAGCLQLGTLPASSGPLLLATPSPSQAILSVVACVSCPTAGHEPAERRRLMSRPWLGGDVPPGWEAQKPQGSYPGPHRHAVKVLPHPFLPLPAGKMAFVPGSTLSQPVGGGRGKGAAWEAG